MNEEFDPYEYKTSFKDFTRYVDDSCNGIHIDCYSLPYDELIENVAEDLYNDFNSIREVINIGEDNFWKYFIKYEKEEV